MADFEYSISFKHRGLQVEAYPGTPATMHKLGDTVCSLESVWDKSATPTLFEVLEEACAAIYRLGIAVSFSVSDQDGSLREITIEKPYGLRLPNSGKIGGTIICEVYAPNAAPTKGAKIAAKDWATHKIVDGTTVEYAQAT